MIGWLKGEKIELWNYGSRSGLVLSCNGIGYEIQLSKKGLKAIENFKDISVWAHQLQREDGFSLFGFTTRIERDLFRKLISVPGIGPQLAMTLLEDNEYQQLISIILNKDISMLTKSSGVGKRTAERIILELQNKLSEFNFSNGSSNQKRNEQDLSKIFEETVIREVRSALGNLGYTDLNITEALNTIAMAKKRGLASTSDEGSFLKNIDFDYLFKETLMTLNQEIGYKAT